MVSHFYGTEFDMWAGFGLVLGRLAVLKTAEPKLLLATFESNFLMFLWAIQFQLCLALLEIHHRVTYV